MRRILGLLIVIALVMGTVSAQGEPVDTVVPNCHLNNPNYHALRSIDATDPERTVCTYGARAVSPCQSISPKGLVLVRAAVKPDGRIKCVYTVGG